MAELDRATRERLLNWAEEVVASCQQGKDGDKVLKKTSLVLFDLKQRRDLNWMRQLLDAKHASKMGEDHWNAFRKTMKKYLSCFERDFPGEEQRVDAWLYFLGWLHRQAKRARSKRPDRTRRRRLQSRGT